MPVKQQLAIALYRFGHYGNAASTMKVALWAGVGFGTVERVWDPRVGGKQVYMGVYW